MSEKEVNIDSGMLQFIPKGAYYEETNEQYKRVMEMWKALFDYDRVLFCLISLLAGSGFSKGSMSHMLLSNPQTTGLDLVPRGLSIDFETKIIQYNLHKERTPRALKNLIMLAGGEGKTKVNNARSRKIILDFIFNRNNQELDALAINYKSKLRTLVRHALGKYDLYHILNGDVKLFNKWIGRYNPDALPVLYHLFDQELPKGETYKYFKKIDQYYKLREAAKSGNTVLFKKRMKGLPQRTVIGFRNTFKLDIDLKDVYEKSTRSKRDSLQSESAAKRTGAKIKVDYKNQDIYDLWKALYHKVQTEDYTNISKIVDALEYQVSKMDKLNIGETIVIADASRSMQGSDQRPLHPFLTALSIISLLDDSSNKGVIFVGGHSIQVKDDFQVLFPSGATNLWRGLIDAVVSGVDNILVISDGYENSIKGMFNHVYKHFKNSGYNFKLMHINPVFSADSKHGTVRMLAEDVTPLPVSDYKYLETEIIFKQLLSNREMVKQLLVTKYNKLIEEGG